MDTILKLDGNTYVLTPTQKVIYEVLLEDYKPLSELSDFDFSNASDDERKQFYQQLLQIKKHALELAFKITRTMESERLKNR